MKKRVLVLSVMVMMLAITVKMEALELFADDFDATTTTLVGWKRNNSSYVTKYTGSYKNGLAAMRLRKNYYAYTYINVAPFKNMVLKFKMAASSLEGSEYVRCQYKLDNGSWVTAKTLSNGSDNGVYRSYSVNVPNCNILQIRFIMGGADTSDYGYIDDVVLTGSRK